MVPIQASFAALDNVSKIWLVKLSSPCFLEGPQYILGLRAVHNRSSFLANAVGCLSGEKER